VLLFLGESAAVCSTRCFRREMIHLEQQKHTFAVCGLCFAQIAETAPTLGHMSSNEVDLPRD
jgi:hypothetical protein